MTGGYDGEGIQAGLFLLRPQPGKVIEISIRHHRLNLRVGFCKALLHLGPYIQILDAFRCGMNPSMTLRWAEPHDFGIQPFGRLAFSFAPEADWMSFSRPTECSR